MEALIGLLKVISSVQVILQIFVGGAAMMLIGHMVVRARGDRQAIPAVPTPATPSSLSDIPQPFLQGPREVVEVLREIRDYFKRKAEDSSRPLDCMRTIKDEAKQRTEEVAQIADLIRAAREYQRRRTEILDRMERK